MITIGTEYGGHTVPINGLNRRSIVYSFGVGEDASFDIGLSEIYGCDVNMFDPTPRSIKYYEDTLSNNRMLLFNPIGVASFNGDASFYTPKDKSHVSHSMDNLQDTTDFITVPVRRLSTIMRNNCDSKIDLLKLDVEGAEFTVLRDMMACGLKPKIICVEFHRDSNAIVNELMAYGYSVISIRGNDYTFVS